MAAAGGRPATDPRHPSISYYILYIVCCTMSISLGACEYFCNSSCFCLWSHIYLRPDLCEEGPLACCLPWQRDEIQAQCSGIRVAVRDRGRGMELTLVGLQDLAEEVFQQADTMAKAHIRSNFVKGITAVTDHPSSTKAEKRKKPAEDQSELQAMQYRAGRLRNKDG